MNKKSQFPAIYVESFSTANNVHKQEIALNFGSGDMFSALVFKPSQVEELIIGLQKSLKRIKEREQ